jgi:hypothetical protein
MREAAMLWEAAMRAMWEAAMLWEAAMRAISLRATTMPAIHPAIH